MKLQSQVKPRVSPSPVRAEPRRPDSPLSPHLSGAALLPGLEAFPTEPRAEHITLQIAASSLCV